MEGRSTYEIDMLAHVSAWLMLACGGLFAGGILFVAVERVNQWRRMPLDQYVVDFRRSVYRLDPFLPILGTVTTVAAGLFALNTRGCSAVLAWMGVSLNAAIIITSIVIAEPINARFRRLLEGQAPANVDQLRVRWRKFHMVRTAMVLASLSCLAAAVL